MKIIQGNYNQAIVYTNSRTIEEKTEEQIVQLLNEPVFAGCKIRIMPDCHSGKGSVIGLSMLMPDKKTICPNLVGVDIGCGVLGYQIKDIKKEDVNFKELDDIIRKLIPLGFSKHTEQVHKKTDEGLDIKKDIVNKIIATVDKENALLSMGTLGGGNHFIEMGEDPKGRVWIFVHSGSRKMGLEIAAYYQSLAEQYSQNVVADKDLSFLSEGDAEKYLADVKLATSYAQQNRIKILDTIAKAMDWEVERSVDSVHNTIAAEQGKFVLRKGSIPAPVSKSVLIPLNMAEGVILAMGKGNEEWNNTAPHGAGRLLSRSAAKEQLKIKHFEKSMEDVFSTCVGEFHLDEAPAAYKPSESIIKAVKDTVDIVFIVKSFYNIKG